MTGLALNGKQLDVEQLAGEMAVAGVVVTGLGTANDTLYTFDQSGQPADLPAGAAAVVAAHVPSTALHDLLVSVLTSSVGVSLSALTQAQRLALVAALLCKAGAVDKHTLLVKPLNTWLL